MEKDSHGDYRYKPRCIRKTLCVMLLILGGDVQLNPGPIKHPCSICLLSVRSNQRAVLCDGCHLWSHIKCSGVSLDDYDRLQVLSEFDWICPRCVAAQMPFADCSVLSSPTNRGSVSSNRVSIGSPSCSISVRSDSQKSSVLYIKLLNTRSMLSAVEDLLYYVPRIKPDVLGICETWLDESIEDTEICPEGWSLVRRDRNRRGGGVALMISNHLRWRARPDLSDGSIESVWIELFPASCKRSTLLCCSYRPPSSSSKYFEVLESECNNALASEGTGLLVMGDLNCDLSKSHLPQTKLLLSFCDRLLLSDVVKKPTRITPTSSGHLDVMLSNTTDQFSNATTDPFGKSDHLLVSVCFHPRRCHSILERKP